MRRITIVFVLCLLLSGCSGWMQGQYVSVKPHTEQPGWEEDEIVAVYNYRDMCDALADMVSNGAQSGVLSVDGLESAGVTTNMQRAVNYIKNDHPLGAYAVEEITFELGTSRGVSAVAVEVTYNHNRSELLRMKKIKDTETLEGHVATALRQCLGSMVVYVESFQNLDLVQVVRDYADANPSQVMQTPHVTVNLYPNDGEQRVVELLFTYQASAQTLRSMQAYVQPVFSAAALYVSGEGEQQVKFAQMYSFLMERNDYQIATSVTPAYSLLRHGVGDSKAFAVVYTAMCRRAGLDCQTIFGTKRGEPWYWNIICEDGVYYHVDLLESHATGNYTIMTDSDMQGYVWDYSAYPACGVAPVQPEQP